ncbi:MAG: hypothetical protein ABIM50_02625 [Novosphingobium sp.]
MSGGWQAVSEAIAAARAEIAAAAPDAETAVEGEAYVARILTSTLANAFLGHLLTDDGLARALPTHGGPNPDYLMRHAGVSMDSRYTVHGQLNSSDRVGIGLYRFDASGTAFEVGYQAFDAGNADASGRFSLEVSPDALPDGLAITPEARALLIRTLHRAPGEQPARLVLDGAPSSAGLTLATGSTDGALTFVARGLVNTVRQFLEWTRVTSTKPNRFDFAPPHLAAAVQGDPDTVYLLGYYELAEGEWLEVLMPEGLSGYWSLHAYNHWTENLQTQGAHDRNVQADDDGRIRVRIGPDIPAEALNRIDTAGRRRGMLIARLIGSAATEPPATRIVRGRDIAQA